MLFKDNVKGRRLAADGTWKVPARPPPTRRLWPSSRSTSRPAARGRSASPPRPTAFVPLERGPGGGRIRGRVVARCGDGARPVREWRRTRHRRRHDTGVSRADTAAPQRLEGRRRPRSTTPRSPARRFPLQSAAAAPASRRGCRSASCRARIRTGGWRQANRAGFARWNWPITATPREHRLERPPVRHVDLAAAARHARVLVERGLEDDRPEPRAGEAQRVQSSAQVLRVDPRRAQQFERPRRARGLPTAACLRTAPRPDRRWPCRASACSATA